MASALLLVAACGKDEAPKNAECDILQMTLHLADPTALFFDAADTLQVVSSTTTQISVGVRPAADLSALAPVFTLSEGATISPANGSEHDFSQPVTYTVTSEDGEQHRTYTVSFIPQAQTLTGDTLKLDFEHYRLDPDQDEAFYVWYEVDAAGNELPWWASGNLGYRLTLAGQTPDDYPTSVEPQGYDGAAVRLVTRSTGALGAFMHKYIAAGNLYIGTFDVSQTTTNPLGATKFGTPFSHKPAKLEGYYQYTPGEVFTDGQNEVVEGRVDVGTIYAVFFRNKEGDERVEITGADIMTNPNIVSVARMETTGATNGWTRFEALFEPRDGMEVDPELLRNNGYSLTVVLSSSTGGDLFEGAVGSTLLADKLMVVCDPE